MVRVDVGEGDHRERLALELPEDPPAGPLRGGIDQHVFHQVDVDPVRRKSPKLK